MPATVALTGGTGFIGRHLAATLAARGWRVRLLARRPPFGLEAVVPEVVAGRLDDAAALDELVCGAEAVVHAAGIVRARGAAAFHRVNAEGTGALVRAVARAGSPPRRFVLISSLAARAPQLSPYAASKRAAEEALAGLPAATAAIALRPTAVYGPGDAAMLPAFRAAARGLVLTLDAPSARLSFVHGADVAHAVAAALANDERGTHALDDGTPGGYGWADVAAALGAAAGTRPRILALPSWALIAAGTANGGLGRMAGRTPFFTAGKAREIAHPDWSCDADRWPGLAALAPTRIADGFPATARWYRTQGWLQA